MTNTDYRARLTFYERKRRNDPPNVPNSVTLPPRDVFKSAPAALAAYDDYTATRDARAKHWREARTLRDKAATARREFNQAIREAITAGKPTDKLTDKHDELIAKAVEHEAIAEHASAQLIKLGLVLGEAIRTAAPDLFPEVENVMEHAAEKVRDDVEKLRQSWAKWSAAWQIRLMLSRIHLNGGQLSNYDPANPLPADVAAALDTLTSRLNDLEVLKHDEAELTRWRGNPS